MKQLRWNLPMLWRTLRKRGKAAQNHGDEPLWYGRKQSLGTACRCSLSYVSEDLPLQIFLAMTDQDKQAYEFGKFL